MSNLNSEIGKRISTLRKERHMTQEQLAEALDISIKHCSCVERGVSALSLEKLIEICDIFDTSLDYLVRGKVLDVLFTLPSSFTEILTQISDEEQVVLKEYLNLYSKIKSFS
ncbi:MAG: helix-turn-helix transcriptional regulator [Lachnospiraceae bacterium]|nr:helix-turn-helix transcriptional regulator [Lachnospiraceae bacterium]